MSPQCLTRGGNPVSPVQTCGAAFRRTSGAHANARPHPDADDDGSHGDSDEHTTSLFTVAVCKVVLIRHAELAGAYVTIHPSRRRWRRKGKSAMDESSRFELLTLLSPSMAPLTRKVFFSVGSRPGSVSPGKGMSITDWAFGPVCSGLISPTQPNMQP